MPSPKSSTWRKLEAIRSGELSAVENVELFLERIRELNPKLNAYIDVRPEKSIRQAKNVDKQLQAGKVGKLSGLCIAVKANINVKGFTISCASKTLSNYIAPYDAEVIRRIKREQGIIIGITNMDEFACGTTGCRSFYGPTINPRAEGRVPGGSSSGSAVAVAAELCDLALGSDTGGSIRAPACWCGVVGLKPTYGLVPRQGLIDLAMSLDQVGPFSPDVYGAALLLEVIAGYNPNEVTTLNVLLDGFSDNIDGNIDGFRIGLAKQYEELCNPKIYSKVSEVLNMVERSFDVEVVEVSLPSIEKALSAYYIIVSAEFYSATRRFDGRRYGFKIEDVCLDEVLRRIVRGSYVTRKEYRGRFYEKALQVRTIVKQEFLRAFKKCDVIVGPTMPTFPPKIGEELSPLEEYSLDVFTIPANLAGICAGTVPIGLLEGVPVGLQVQAPHLHEVKVLNFMQAVSGLVE
ncbi:MAG: Asp-tRNA(Asn)/Glu-tRNA(Gln) amidotransferase GatCAB subunit A [Candidatus Methanomethylicota archaeon]|uniref:Glutamyl-tRNA(Gln) amidotransferase subunit A n=1 Tax=Thermoproteota archaeon TaxID=2056631 RepID=A0A497EVM8_9CREN|nr:MAG: Asp-tRNA(Asn)/Glu-tRNA(Gln) amidotransferase GatCAB subunit A [Candidatus Verstraetearchaeota archaeon]